MNGLRFARKFHFVLAAALIGLTGCQNGNLFGKLHDSGDSSNTQTLLSDGSQALRNQDYSSALGLYQRVLNNDPNNSEALYGAATAEIGLSGLNFGQLLANLLNKDGTVSATSLGDAIVSNSVGMASVDVLNTSILKNLYTDALGLYVENAVSYLKSLATGQSDRKINTDDVAMLVDLSIASLIDAGYLLLKNGICDIVNDNGTLKVVTKTSAAAFCGNAANAGVIKDIGYDFTRAYVALNRAASKSSSSTTVIARFRDDVYKVINEGLNGNGTNDLDPACVSALASDGITASSFVSVSDI